MFTVPFLAVVTVFSAGVSLVHAHGYVKEVVANGETYTGSDPWADPPPECVIRKIPANGPVVDLDLIDIQCNGDSNNGGNGTEPAGLVATIEAGTELSLKWTDDWPDSHVGPVITYLAAVPDGTDITAYSPGTDPVWFKIDEAGKNEQGEWAGTDGLYANNLVYSVTIPESLRPGQYIVRHEIIALHESFSYPGSQFYPSCIQIEVQGCGDAFPSDEDLVSFPGAYTPETPGIVFDVYTDDGSYPIPGPPVWTP